MLVRNVKLNDKTYFVPKTARRHEDEPVQAVQGAGGRDRLALGLQRAVGQVRHVERHGKCVSAMKKSQNAAATQEQILAAITSCKAEGLQGTALGNCVAARDGVAATPTERKWKHKSKKRP